MTGELYLSGSAANRTSIGSVAIVFLSTFLLRTHGATYFSDLVVFGANFLGSTFTSIDFMDKNSWLIWWIAPLINVVVFSIIAVPVWFFVRSKNDLLCSLLLGSLCLTHLLMLFLLFPATDGP